MAGNKMNIKVTYTVKIIKTITDVKPWDVDEKIAEIVTNDDWTMEDVKPNSLELDDWEIDYSNDTNGRELEDDQY